MKSSLCGTPKSKARTLINMFNMQSPIVAKKAEKVFHHQRLRHLINYNSAEILNHFKSGRIYKKDTGTQKKVIAQYFYKIIISRVLPYRNLTQKFMLPNSKRKYIRLRVMEVSRQAGSQAARQERKKKLLRDGRFKFLHETCPK